MGHTQLTTQETNNKEGLDKLIEDLTHLNGLNNLKIILEKLIYIVANIETKDEKYDNLEDRISSLEGYVVPFYNETRVIEEHGLGRNIDPLVVIDGNKAIATVINSSDLNTVEIIFTKPKTGYVVIK